MAGKRLLDALKLANASSSIAKQHFAIRRQQWDVYTRTSSLAKAVKSQTDRVTVTAAAGLELARRFNETGPVWQDRSADARREAAPSSQTSEDVGVPTQGVGVATGTEREVKQRADSVVETARDQVAEASREEHDDGTLSSLRRRELQRQAERQIPSATADAEGEQPATSGQDTFSTRNDHASPELSSLPRTKLPKHTDSTPDASASKDLNQDTFPTPQAEPEAAPEGVNTDVFSSPKVSQMLRKSGEAKKNPYANRQKLPPKPLPEMLAARETWEAEKKGQSQSAPRFPEQAESAHAELATATSAKSAVGDAETQDLAASIAQEAAVGHRFPCRCCMLMC